MQQIKKKSPSNTAKQSINQINSFTTHMACIVEEMPELPDSIEHLTDTRLLQRQLFAYQCTCIQWYRQQRNNPLFAGLVMWCTLMHPLADSSIL